MTFRENFKMLKYVKGNLIDMAFAGEFDIIAHGCNCFNTWGAGIAKEMKVKCPSAYKEDMKTKKGDKSKLGSFTIGVVNGDISDHVFLVCNFYTQYDYGRGLKFNYDKFRECLINFRRDMTVPYFRIGMPKIGAGHAGGDWNKIEQIIIDELGDLDVTIVEWDGRS
jgi:O-acetyl-ADP-ribose deacetylase (regulator of RNase III)